MFPSGKMNIHTFKKSLKLHIKIVCTNYVYKLGIEKLIKYDAKHKSH